MLERLDTWKCTKCKRLYHEELKFCQCEGEISVGHTVGVFKILTKNNGRKLEVTCILCGLDTEIDTSNIRRQKSCGCKPRHIDVINSSEKEIRYTCRKCGKSHVVDVPVFSWCCDELGED